MAPILTAALGQAKAQFEYRRQATGRELPCDPDWRRVMGDSLKPALAGERGDTDQQQCAFQAIRLTLWESGVVRAPWTRAFPRPTPQVAPALAVSAQTPGLQAVQPIAWYQLWWAKAISWGRSILKRLNDLV